MKDRIKLILISFQMFMTPRGTIFSLTTSSSPYCGNVDYQRFNIVPVILTPSSEASGLLTDIFASVRSDRHIYTNVACYAEDANRTMCTLSLPMCLCGSPQYIRLQGRSLYSNDFGTTKPYLLNNYFEALFLGSNNTYCHVQDSQAGYPANICVGVLLDSNGSSL
jgi:hypothetical protein